MRDSGSMSYELDSKGFDTNSTLVDVRVWIQYGIKMR